MPKTWVASKQTKKRLLFIVCINTTAAWLPATLDKSNNKLKITTK